MITIHIFFSTDAAIVGACVDVFPGVTHILCRWHVDRYSCLFITHASLSRPHELLHQTPSYNRLLKWWGSHSTSQLIVLAACMK